MVLSPAELRFSVYQAKTDPYGSKKVAPDSIRFPLPSQGSWQRRPTCSLDREIFKLYCPSDEKAGSNKSENQSRTG